MVNDNVWDFTNHKGEGLPKPVYWDTHPEWFDQGTGRAKRIRGPRFVSSANDKPWHWGPTEWVRDIGSFVVLCFRWDKSNYMPSQQEDHGVLGYAVWIEGVEIDCIWESLDKALVDAVRFKYEGRRGSSGPRATEYFFKMIGYPDRSDG